MACNRTPATKSLNLKLRNFCYRLWDFNIFQDVKKKMLNYIQVWVEVEHVIDSNFKISRWWSLKLQNINGKITKFYIVPILGT